MAQFKMTEARFTDGAGHEIVLRIDANGSPMYDAELHQAEKNEPVKVAHGSFITAASFTHAPAQAASAPQSQTVALAYRLCGPYRDAAGNIYYIPC
jgi:hypothetical protein